ncbi:CPBP family intramembrane glutamic endopeptidase [Fusibacillus kribbianus]|uniref:Type II CAAX endopeptidase family protein n=1 Tax=Fusibacillus kribbianus TaxID=3044208 RepID=A0AAP4BC35_9FIRM|nr:type II CAAX endopeptidase family protein [Ruminococcus sp. YH-rum2234]MDI9243137.1 type II CAAX endopeptidase family protein [Ruminococcus sp. YH-rum2234]
MEKQESWGRRIWRLIYPGLTYYGVCFIVEVIAAVWIAFSTVAGYDANSLNSEMNYIINEMLERTLSVALELQVLAALITLPLLILYYRMDRKRDVRFGRVRRFTQVPSWKYVLVAVLGMATCLAGNNLIAISGLYEISDSYEAISELLYGGKLVLESVGLGIIVPVVEELIFRGLMYRRMREYMSIGTAAVVCSLIFGFYHGNLVQGIYAFLLSLLFIYVYERFHSMLAPILFHAAANVLSVLVSETGMLDGIYRSAVPFWSCTILACAVLIGMVYLIENFVHSEEIPVPAATEALPEEIRQEEQDVENPEDRQ